MQDTLHNALIQLCCREDGWQTGSWRTAFRAKCQERLDWISELNGDADGILTRTRFNPDAWRLVVEDDILVVEFLEVEITHPIPLDKRRDYVYMWFALDATCNFHMRVYRAERYGKPLLWLDAETAHREIAL